MRKENGFTLIEVLVGIGLLAIVVVSVFTGIQLLFKVLNQSQNKVMAVDLARERIEVMRSIPYIDIGTENGIPAGDLPQTTTRKVGNTTFTVQTDIIFIDDLLDDLSPEDTLPADYKKARVTVSWLTDQGERSIVEIANFSPPGLESEIGGGILSIYVNDSQSGEPVPNAQVRIINSEVDPAVYIYTSTDDNGWLSRPGLLASEDYQISAYKNNYDEHQTYAGGASFTPNPAYAFAQVAEGEKTVRYLTISETSVLTVETADSEGSPIGNIAFSLQGGREIGLNPLTEEKIYSYDNDSLTTDSSGSKQLTGMSGGEYYLTINNSSYNVLAPDLDNPIILESDGAQTISVILEPK